MACRDEGVIPEHFLVVTGANKLCIESPPLSTSLPYPLGGQQSVPMLLTLCLGFYVLPFCLISSVRAGGECYCCVTFPTFAEIGLLIHIDLLRDIKNIG